jgi:hypothetical protein
MTNRSDNKQQFYEYDPDANSYAGIGFTVGAVDDDNDDSAKVTNLHRDDTPMAFTWKPLTCHGFEDNPSEVGDFPSVSNWRIVPMMSERAWTALKPIIRNGCEALPVSHPFTGAYFLIHVLRTIEALDEDASEVERRSADDPRIRQVFCYAFRNDKIEGIHIFKLPNKQGGGLIVDDLFRKTVEDNNLRGLRFRKLPLTQES